MQIQKVGAFQSLLESTGKHWASALLFLKQSSKHSFHFFFLFLREITKSDTRLFAPGHCVHYFGSLRFCTALAEFLRPALLKQF